jgi:lysophospholipase L1-like esterase
MKYFDIYTSNTLAAAANQHFFMTEDSEREYTSRVFYKIFAGGKYNYSFLFSNIIDSTYSDGSVSHMNLVCDEWEIVSASVAIADNCEAKIMPSVSGFRRLTFGGNCSKTVNPGEFFSSDPIEIDANKGQFICLEITFKGSMIPYHEESIIPIFSLRDGEWVYDKKMPLACMVGCDRQIKKRVGFIGDSITQGIGTPINSYEHYASVIADIIGEENSYWNIGIGYGRGNDAATDGAWLFKAKQLDVITVCFGVNDINRGFSADHIINSLETIMDKLHRAGVKVIMQTIPPFNYSGARIETWNRVNEHILGSMAERAEGIFDVRKILSLSEDEPYMAKFGGHPDSKGNGLWGRALAEAVEKTLNI